MAQTTYSLRMDNKLKRSFDEICEELGLTATVAINIFAKTLVKEKRIPFEISTKEADETKNLYLQNFQSMKDDVAKSQFANASLNEINNLIKNTRKK